MALTYIYLTNPLAEAFALSGKIYQANSLGVITGVTPLDALSLNTLGGNPLIPLCATGATTDRPNVIPGTAVVGLNNVNPAPAFGFPFHDTTLGTECYYVGTGRASTGWVDRTGAAV